MPHRRCVTNAPIGSVEVTVRRSSTMSCCASTGKPQPGHATSPCRHALRVAQSTPPAKCSPLTQRSLRARPTFARTGCDLRPRSLTGIDVRSGREGRLMVRHRVAFALPRRVRSMLGRFPSPAAVANGRGESSAVRVHRGGSKLRKQGGALLLAILVVGVIGACSAGATTAPTASASRSLVLAAPTEGTVPSDLRGDWATNLTSSNEAVTLTLTDRTYSIKRGSNTGRGQAAVRGNEIAFQVAHCATESGRIAGRSTPVCCASSLRLPIRALGGPKS